MPSYKLCYFNAKGYAEMSRLLFAEAGVEYEDVRYSHEEWPKHKPDMLFNQMPVLFVDGEQIAHSRAAFRYLARKFNMDGGDEITAAKIDMWVEVINETFMKIPFGEQDEKKKAEESAVVLKEFIEPRLKKLEELYEKNKGTYAFGDSISALDIFILPITGVMDLIPGGLEVLNKFPKIKAMSAAIEARPRIAKWLAEAPKVGIC